MLIFKGNKWHIKYLKKKHFFSNTQMPSEKVYMKFKGTKVQRLADSTHSKDKMKNFCSKISTVKWNVISKLNIEPHVEFKTSKYHI